MLGETTTQKEELLVPIARCLKSKAVVVPFAASREENGAYACVSCGQTLFLKHSAKNRPYFAHTPNAVHVHGSDQHKSIMHNAAKHYLAVYFKRFLFVKVCYRCRQNILYPDTTSSFLDMSLVKTTQEEFLFGEQKFDVVYFDEDAKVYAFIEVQHTRLVDGDKWQTLLQDGRFKNVIELNAQSVVDCFDTDAQNGNKVLCWTFGDYCDECNSILYSDCSVCNKTVLKEYMHGPVSYSDKVNQYVCNSCFDDNHFVWCTQCHKLVSNVDDHNVSELSICHKCYRPCNICAKHIPTLYGSCETCFKSCLECAEKIIAVDQLACISCLHEHTNAHQECTQCHAYTFILDGNKSCMNCTTKAQKAINQKDISEEVLTHNYYPKSFFPFENSSPLRIHDDSEKKVNPTPTKHKATTTHEPKKSLKKPKTEKSKSQVQEIKKCITCLVKPQLYWQFQECEDCSRSKVRNPLNPL